MLNPRQLPLNKRNLWYAFLAVILLVLSEVTVSSMADLLKARFDLSGSFWFALLGLLVLMASIWLSLYSVSRGVVTEVVRPSMPSARRAYVGMLSLPHGDTQLRELTEKLRDLRHALQNAPEVAFMDELKRVLQPGQQQWNGMPWFYGLAHHRQRVEHILILRAMPAAGSQRELAEQYSEAFKGLLSLYCLNERHISFLDLESDIGIQAGDVISVQQELRKKLNDWMRQLDLPEEELILDVTSGTKIYSIAAALAVLDKRWQFQYTTAACVHEFQLEALQQQAWMG